jgi:hypothetical protein
MQAEALHTHPHALLGLQSPTTPAWRARSEVQRTGARDLTLDEVGLVSGGFGPVGAGIGAVIGGIGYGFQSAIGGGGSWGGLISTMAGGALAGGFGGFTAVGAVWSFNGAMVSGIGGGMAMRYAMR